MPRIATMGTFSCATFAIGWFKGQTKEENEQYRADPDNFKLTSEGMSVQDWLDEILLPIKQPLGQSRQYPFDMLMDKIEKCNIDDKFVIATLNHQQYQYEDQYWHNRLLDRGFSLIDKTQNSHGGKCYIYTRNKARTD